MVVVYYLPPPLQVLQGYQGLERWIRCPVSRGCQSRVLARESLVGACCVVTAAGVVERLLYVECFLGRCVPV